MATRTQRSSCCIPAQPRIRLLAQERSQTSEATAARAQTLNGAPRILLAKFRDHVGALEVQIAMMQDRQMRNLHHILDLAASSPERGKMSGAALQALLTEDEILNFCCLHALSSGGRSPTEPIGRFQTCEWTGASVPTIRGLVSHSALLTPASTLKRERVST